MVLHAVRTEPPLEQVGDAAMFKLTGLNIEQIVRESEEPKTRIAQLAQRRRNLRVWRHRGKLFGELSLVLVANFEATGIRSIFITADPISVNGT